MRIYISGISGTGMGPLALMAKSAGFEVVGSDLGKGAIYDELVDAGIEVKIGPQDGEFLRRQLERGVDWFVYTSALPATHAELKLANEAGVKVSKRDDFTNFLVEKLGLKMIAVAGTHGKTTTTAMIVYIALKMGLPVSYVVGSTLGFAPSGAYHEGDKYFVYEADEYDRNFLKFHPWLAVITEVSYDHPDIYKTEDDYKQAFAEFKSQSEKVIEKVPEVDFAAADVRIVGEARRHDGVLAAMAVSEISDRGFGEILRILNDFPGVGRRFERIADGLYSDYAHHPEEIVATIEIAREAAEMDGKRGVVVIYEPHQNIRQHEIFKEYADAFVGAGKIYWLPTYLTREDPELAILKPEDFIASLKNFEVAEAAEMGDRLKEEIEKYLADGYLVILMTAGPADKWLRENFDKNES